MRSPLACLNILAVSSLFLASGSSLAGSHPAASTGKSATSSRPRTVVVHTAPRAVARPVAPAVIVVAEAPSTGGTVSQSREVVPAPAVSGLLNPIARAGRFGLGLNAGSPTSGITAKYYFTNRVAVQLVVGRVVSYGGISAGLDGVYEMPVLWQNSDMAVNWTVGGGVNYGSANVYGVPVKVTYASALAGLGMQLKAIPLETVFELRPGYLSVSVDGLGSEGGASMGANLSLRYFF